MSHFICKNCGHYAADGIQNPIGEGNFCCDNCLIDYTTKGMGQQYNKLPPLEIESSLKQAAKHDPVDHPKHYTSHPSGVECIQVTRHMNFNRGNAIKYIWRCGDKGNPIEDLKKAVWYLQDEIKRIENETPNRTT